jgi:hypothetical protein
MHGRRVAFALLAAVFFMVAGARPALACSCATPHAFEDAAPTADMAFEGRMTRRWPTLLWNAHWGPSLSESYDFEISRSFKNRMTMARLEFGGTNCGAAFSEGVTYRVIASRDSMVGERATASWCSPISVVSDIKGPDLPPPPELPHRNGAARQGTRSRSSMDRSRPPTRSFETNHGTRLKRAGEAAG